MNISLQQPSSCACSYSLVVNKRRCSLLSGLSCLVGKGNLFLLFVFHLHYLDSGSTT